MKKYIATILLFCSVSVGQSLNVDECVRIALENKPSLKRAEQDVTIARLNRASTGALMLPSVNATILSVRQPMATVLQNLLRDIVED